MTFVARLLLLKTGVLLLWGSFRAPFLTCEYHDADCFYPSQYYASLRSDGKALCCCEGFEIDVCEVNVNLSFRNFEVGRCRFFTLSRDLRGGLRFLAVRREPRILCVYACMPMKWVAPLYL